MARLAWLRSHIGLVAMVGAGGVLLVGVAAFLVSFRDVRIAIPPGMVLEYELTLTVRDQHAGQRPGPEQRQSRRLWLVGLGGREVAVCRDASEQHRVEVVALDDDGQVRLLDGAGRAKDAGPALGVFDLNLLRLPPDQPARGGEVTVVHAALPPGRRQVQAVVKRTKAGASSQYQLRFKADVPWVGEDGRYRTLRGVVCEFSADGVRGMVVRAEARGVLDIELPQPHSHVRREWTVELQLRSAERSGDDPARLAATAHRLAGLPDAAPARRRELIDGLRSDTVACPPMQRAVAAVLASTWQRSGDTALRRVLLVVEGARGSRDEAERAAVALRGLGLSARVDQAAGRTRVLLGPWDQPDPAVAARVQQRLGVPPERVRWMEVR